MSNLQGTQGQVPATPGPTTGTATARTPGGTPIPPPPPRLPPKPNMATIEETTPNTYVYAFGGVPNYDFKGLENESGRKLRSTMYRPLDPTSDTKNVKTREKGLEFSSTFQTPPSKLD